MFNTICHEAIWPWDFFFSCGKFLNISLHIKGLFCHHFLTYKNNNFIQFNLLHFPFHTFSICVPAWHSMEGEILGFSYRFELLSGSYLVDFPVCFSLLNSDYAKYLQFYLSPQHFLGNLLLDSLEDHRISLLG